MTISNGECKLIRPNRVVNRQVKTLQRIFKNLEQYYWTLLVESTIFFYVLQCPLNLFIADHNADAFRTVIPPPKNDYDFYVRKIFDGFQRWDSQHYLHIAMYDYTFENNLAFFPMFPYLLRIFAEIFQYLTNFTLSNFTCLLISGVLINAVAFCLAGHFLFKLTFKVFGDVNLALKTVVLFAVNPAFIFFRTIYTESFFCFLTYLGLYCLTRATFDKPSPIIESAVCFAISCLIRSNGLLNFGYLAFVCLCFALTANSKYKTRSVWKKLKIFTKYAFILLICGLIMFLPFAMLQYYQYVSFCTPESAKIVLDYRIYELGRNNSYVFPGELKKLPWCQRFPFILPYTAVQGRYWDVGFLGYFQLKKIPNFLLALPSLTLALAACFHFLTEMRLSDGEWAKKLLNSDSLVVYVVHVMILVVVSLFFINVEVSTRMLFSSSPVLIWYACKVLEFKNEDGTRSVTHSTLIPYSCFGNGKLVCLIHDVWKLNQWKGRLILIYFLSYAIVGTALHINFYPWT